MNGQFEKRVVLVRLSMKKRCRGPNVRRHCSVWLQLSLHTLRIFGHLHLFVLRMWLIHSWKDLGQQGEQLSAYLPLV